MILCIIGHKETKHHQILPVRPKVKVLQHKQLFCFGRTLREKNCKNKRLHQYFWGVQ